MQRGAGNTPSEIWHCQVNSNGEVGCVALRCRSMPLGKRPEPVAQGRAMRNDCTFAPPAIRGFDGSKCSRSSRFRTSARATTKASFRLLACRSATLKKAEIGPLSLVPAAERWMVRIGRGDDQHIGVREMRDKDS